VGIRSVDGEEVPKLDPERIFYAHALAACGRDRDWFEQVSARLSQDVYVTIDLDCFDPSIMPSTGTPEPGGMNWYQVTGLLRYVAERHRIVGFDVVELLPRASDPAPDFLAAKLVYNVLSSIFANR
ncbi:MAG: arginase family protein, partial [Bdellovibrionales bacterium]|nr:arginase family protein [Bdellovibrionales bacterium]